MKYATAEIWDGQSSPFELRVTDENLDLALCSPEQSLESAMEHVKRLQAQTGSEIWLKGVFQVFTLEGKAIIIRPYFYDAETRKNAENKVVGLGQLAYEPREYQGKKYWNWWYKAPSRPWSPVSAKFSSSPNPPPLPQPREEWATCKCHEGEHICGACGKPYWIEIHGIADGYCTYCYYHG